MISKNKPSKNAIVPTLAGLMITAGLLVSFHIQADNMETASTLKSNPSDTIEKKMGCPAIDQMPEFPGGLNKLVRFLQKNIKYPLIAQQNGIEGIVVLTFVVNAAGEISNIRILRSIGGGCDEEAVRVVKLMPKWKPGIQKGKAVPVMFTLPINFAFQKDEHTKK